MDRGDGRIAGQRQQGGGERASLHDGGENRRSETLWVRQFGSCSPNKRESPRCHFNVLFLLWFGRVITQSNVNLWHHDVTTAVSSVCSCIFSPARVTHTKQNQSVSPKSESQKIKTSWRRKVSVWLPFVPSLPQLTASPQGTTSIHCPKTYIAFILFYVL